MKVVVQVDRVNHIEEDVYEDCLFRIEKKTLIVYRLDTEDTVAAYTKYWLKVVMK